MTRAMRLLCLQAPILLIIESSLRLRRKKICQKLAKLHQTLLDRFSALISLRKGEGVGRRYIEAVNGIHIKSTKRRRRADAIHRVKPESRRAAR